MRTNESDFTNDNLPDDACILSSFLSKTNLFTNTAEKKERLLHFQCAVKCCTFPLANVIGMLFGRIAGHLLGFHEFRDLNRRQVTKFIHKSVA